METLVLLDTYPVFGQLEQFEWKTYVNPEYKFTFEYPENQYFRLQISPTGSSIVTETSKSEFGYHASLGITLIKYSEIVFPDLSSYAQYAYKNTMNNPDNKTLQNITNSEYTQFPTYSFMYYSNDEKPREFRIIKEAYQLHNNTIYVFHLSDLNADTHFEEFDRMVNSLKFFN